MWQDASRRRDNAIAAVPALTHERGAAGHHHLHQAAVDVARLLQLGGLQERGCRQGSAQLIVIAHTQGAHMF